MLSASLAVVLFSHGAGAAAPSCLDESGNSVDYAYAFKYARGWDYAYMDASTDLTHSSYSLNSADSSISQTLSQILGSDVYYVMWNDQPTTGSATHAPTAHAKGVLAFTSEGGFWLTHSLPLFPAASARSATGLWNDGSSDYGQSFLCINVDADTIEKKISPVMMINRPTVYGQRFGSDASTAFPGVQSWAIDREYDDDDVTTKEEIKTMGGSTFWLYGKSGEWGTGKDLYRDLVAPDVGAMYMEGWRHGAGVWNAACGQNQVLDVLSVSFPDQDWATTDDHSKWAVAQTGTTFCVGDINRADGQDKRGGGTVCIHDSHLASQMRKLITDNDSCRSGSAESILV